MNYFLYFICIVNFKAIKALPLILHFEELLVELINLKFDFVTFLPIKYNHNIIISFISFFF